MLNRHKVINFVKGIFGRIMPTTLSKILFKRTQGIKLDLTNPQTFNEKLMWLKLNNYNHNPLVWKCSDKYLVREFAIENGVSQENLPPLINVYESVNDINFDVLPNKFALKCSHGCGFNIICTDKEKLNYSDAKIKLNRWIKTKFGYATAELHYTHAKPHIICEEFIDSEPGQYPLDYKFYCFNGIPKVVLVCSEREKKLKLNYFDLSWNELLWGKDELRNKKTINKPEKIKDMISICRKVSAKFPFVRVDFYEYNNKAILGEMTFTPAACMATYYNEKGQIELSKYLDIKSLINDCKGKKR